MQSVVCVCVCVCVSMYAETDQHGQQRACAPHPSQATPAAAGRATASGPAKIWAAPCHQRAAGERALTSSYYALNE